jgi:hypothetical protein
VREIRYWFILNVREFLHGDGEKHYYCLQGSTTNPKMAMRYYTEEGAEQQVHALGWEWSAVEGYFSGDEKAI